MDRSGAGCCTGDGQGWALCPSARPPGSLPLSSGGGDQRTIWKPVSGLARSAARGCGDLQALARSLPRDSHAVTCFLSAARRAGSAAGKPGLGASAGCCGPAGPSSWRLCLRGRTLMDATHQKEGRAQDTAVHAPALCGSDGFPDVNFLATGLF